MEAKVEEASTIISEVREERPILCCGLVCLDLVTVVEAYPTEDTDQRSIDQYKVRGGNASNSCSVLALLGFPACYLGSLAADTVETTFILKSFRESGVEVEPASPSHSGHTCPNSVIVLSRGTGSRTIIHTNKGLPELTLQDFQLVDLRRYSWVHMEGRNRENVLDILAYLTHKGQEDLAGGRIPIRVSVEVEKVGRNFEDFIPHADVVFISKEVAISHGCRDMVSAVSHFLPRLRPAGQLIVPWGEAGAAWGEAGSRGSCPAFPPAGGVVDTIGAGDTFNAAVIGSLLRGRSLAESVILACEVAGRKVGRIGFQGLEEDRDKFTSGSQ